MLPVGLRTREASKGATGTLKSTMPLPTVVPVTAIRPWKAMSYRLASGQPVRLSRSVSRSQDQMTWYTHETNPHEQSSCHM